MLLFAAELSLAAFIGMVVAIVTVSAVESKRIEKEPLPQRMPGPNSDPDPVLMFFIEVHYPYIYARADCDAEWMLTTNRHVYNLN